MHFRWRNNPAVLATYMLDKAVPAKAEVILKPNEICVVLENGKVVGSVSQQHLEVNPQVGLIGKLFGKKNPNRAFMFCFSGPHEVMIQVKGQSSEGEEINCMVVLKLEISRESAPRLLNFPARGINTIHTSDLASEFSSAVQSASMEFLKMISKDEMKSTANNDDLIFHLKTQLRTTFDEHGVLYTGAYIVWSSSVAEQRLKREQELERITIENDHASEQKDLELNQLVRTEQRRYELEARMALVGIQAKEKATMNLELERIRNSGALNFETWSQTNRVLEVQNEAIRSQIIQNAQAGVEVAKLNAKMKREEVSVDLEVTEHKTKQAMNLFEQVQARKRDRMQMDSNQEKQRLDNHTKGSEKTIEVLENIAASAKDPMVQMEALKQLSELRRADVTGQKDAYKD
jgi:hypothetical protein